MTGRTEVPAGVVAPMLCVFGAVVVGLFAVAA